MPSSSTEVSPSTQTPPLASISGIVAACVLIACCEGFDLQAAGVAAAGITPELHADAEQLGTFFSASTLGLFMGALIGGRLSDSLGRSRILLVAVLLFGAFSILTAMAHSMQALSWGRLLTGAGLGGAFPNILNLVNECSSPRRRNANVALVYAGMPLGGAAASLTSMLIAPGQWRLIFILGGFAPLLLLPPLRWVLREASRSEARPRSNAAAATSLTLRRPPSRAGHISEIFAHGRAVPTLLFWISSLLELLTLYLLLSWLPTLLVGNGFSKPQAAGVQIVFNLGGAIAAWLMGQLLEGRTRDASIVTALICGPLFVLLLSQAPANLLLVNWLGFGLGAAILAAQSFIYATAPRCYPAAVRGLGVGSVIAMGRLGSIIGPKLGGVLRGAGHSTSQLLLDILPLVVLGSLTALVLAWRTARWRHP